MLYIYHIYKNVFDVLAAYNKIQSNVKIKLCYVIYSYIFVRNLMDSVNTKYIQILETDGYQKCLQKYNSKYLSFLSTVFAHVKPTTTSIEILCYLFFANITAMK